MTRVDPVFGTCPVCGKGYLVDKDGNVRRHQWMLPGHPEFGVLCTGSGQRPAGRAA